MAKRTKITRSRKVEEVTCPDILGDHPAECHSFGRLLSAVDGATLDDLTQKKIKMTADPLMRPSAFSAGIRNAISRLRKSNVFTSTALRFASPFRPTRYSRVAPQFAGLCPFFQFVNDFGIFCQH